MPNSDLPPNAKCRMPNAKCQIPNCGLNDGTPLAFDALTTPRP
jgi:hypothetical protein